MPEYIRSQGVEPIFHIATEDEYWQKLKEKLIEEASEFKEKENIEEYTDILEVLEAIAEYKKFSSSEIEKVKNDKLEKRGAFKKMIILDES